MVEVGNKLKGNFALGSNGTATSYAQNTESASATVTASTAYKPNHSYVAAGVSGATTTDSTGKAYNVSTGSGTGAAMSQGSADAYVHGGLAIHGVTTGQNGGNSGTNTTNLIKAGTNQGSYVVGQTLSGFDVQVVYSKNATHAHAPAGTYGVTNSSTVTVSDSKTGYASGANVTGALAGMNAAGLANIGASGHFFAKAGLEATTGTAGHGH
jgi:hypothetical protein